MFNLDFKRFIWQIGDYTSSPSDLKTLKLGLGFGLGLELSRDLSNSGLDCNELSKAGFCWIVLNNCWSWAQHNNGTKESKIRVKCVKRLKTEVILQKRLWWWALRYTVIIIFLLECQLRQNVRMGRKMKEWSLVSQYKLYTQHKEIGVSYYLK